MSNYSKNIYDIDVKFIFRSLQYLFENDSDLKDDLDKVEYLSIFKQHSMVQIGEPVSSLGLYDNAVAENKPIIFIAAHFGNMELLSTYMNKNILKIHQVARESNFKEIDEFIVKAREDSGSKIIFRKGAVKKLVKALIKKEPIALIIDQNINSKEGTEVEFLGKKAYQTSTSSVLSRKFDAVLIPIAIFNQNDYKYKIKIYEPIEPIKTENEENDIKELSQLQANAISDIILEDKKQWFWPHKRFKSHYREIYEKNTNN